MKRKLTSLLLAAAMALALLPATAFAATVVDRVKVSMTAPTVGKPLPQNLKTSSDSSAELTGFQWEGQLDGDGNMMGGTNYTLTFSLKIKSGKNAKFPKNNSTLHVVFNGTLTATITEMTDKKASGTLTFFINEKGKMEKPAVEKYFTKAEADAKYPLANPITLLISDESIKRAFPESSKNYDVYKYGDPLIEMWRGRSSYPTLDGGVVVDGENEPWVTNIYHETINLYRVNRVVYDLYRKNEASLGYLPNVNEIWLSPKCDIQGVLDTIGREYGKDRHNFNTWNFTLFIPDSVYPNGPTYSGSTIPYCRVMLYSGNDVYAAVKAGKAAARDWCTSHSYTCAITSYDRLYSYATCQSDVRYYYSCAKCGRCEYNPNHTFFPLSNSTDFTEDNGLHTAHDFDDRIITDEHFLGFNANGDRVYLKCCRICGKDERQTDTEISYERYVASQGSEGGRDGWRRYQENRKKVWAQGGSYYNSAIKTTPEKDGLHKSYAIAADKFVWAHVSDWARTEVQNAANAGLVDVSLLGNDYRQGINRLQFCSVAVKMAEKMTGKAITPAPSGTFSDTDNEYARKASAAGITQGAGGGKFNPGGVLTRQEMAAFLYRALMYVKANSDTEYTVYESKLGSYTDSGRLASWAKNEMAFMNALGLIGGTSATTLSPTSPCTVEQALIVACRSLDAGGIGWYQCVKSPSGNMEHYSTSDMCCYTYGDRVWFTSSQGHCVDPYGRAGGVNPKDFYPIKDR